MKKLLYIAPHLSTGGLPQYLVKKIQLLRNYYDIYVVEYGDYTGGKLVVQKNRLKELLINELITLGDNKYELLNVIQKIQPDIIHLEEIPELFCDFQIARNIYTERRTYSIYETSHDSSIDVRTKRFFPDRFILVSEFQRKLFEPLGIPIDVVDYPIEFSDNRNRQQYREDLGLDETKRHILNVGLFTPRKNQKEFFEYARRLPEYQFHSVGNMADNFKYYWEPLLKDVPTNVKIWDERSDVYKFYEAMDLLLFTSRGSDRDKETMPLVLKEAVSANMPIALYNLPVYEGFFDQFNGIYYLDFDDKERNMEIIQSILNTNKSNVTISKNVYGQRTTDIEFEKGPSNCTFYSKWSWEEQKMYYSVSKSLNFPIRVSLREYKSNAVTWSTVYDNLISGVEYWMMPVMKSVHNYETSDCISGIKLCIYDERNGNQLYEYPYFNKFVDIPTIDLSKSIPYHLNYVEFFVKDKYKKYLDKSFDTVVDVGANVGVFTSYILHNKISKKIIAIECDSRAISDLINNFHHNPTVTIIEKALHYNNLGVDFYEDTDNPIVSSVLSVDSINHHNVGVGRSAEVHMVDTITIKELTDLYGVIDLLKIDIEGGEYSIFDKIDNSALENVNNLLIECHFFESDYIEKYQKLISKLIDAGFSVEEFEHNQSEKYRGGSEVIFASKLT